MMVVVVVVVLVVVVLVVVVVVVREKMYHVSCRCICWPKMVFALAFILWCSFGAIIQVISCF